MSEIQELQKSIYYGYAQRTKLDPDAKYLHGTPDRANNSLRTSRDSDAQRSGK